MLQESLEKYDVTLLGAEEEHQFFDKLQNVLEGCNTKNAVVINGWSDHGAKQRKSREFDFLIVSLQEKAFIHIEVKSSLNKGSIEDGIRQVQDGQIFFSEVLPFPEKEHWKYVKVIHFGSKNEEKLPPHCQDCNLYLLNGQTDFNLWWTGLLDHLHKAAPHDALSGQTTYLNILKYLMFQMFLQDNCITPGMAFHYHSV